MCIALSTGEQYLKSKKAVGLGFPCWTTFPIKRVKTKAYSLDCVAWFQHLTSEFYPIIARLCE